MLFHYTDADGYNAIRAQPVWVFKASKPPGDHPEGAYFTTLPPATRKLAQRLRIPASKTEFVFCFEGGDDLVPLEGGRGEYIVYSESDYRVETGQLDHGPSHEVQGRLK